MLYSASYNKHNFTAADVIQNSSNIAVCLPGEAVITAFRHGQRFIFTDGVSACFVVILYWPLKNLAIFAHIDGLVDLKTSQQDLLNVVERMEIPLSDLHVFLAGGLKSMPGMQERSRLLCSFWQQLSVGILNTDLLLSKDILALNLDRNFVAKHPILRRYASSHMQISFSQTSNQQMSQDIVQYCIEQGYIEVDYAQQHPLHKMQFFPLPDCGEVLILEFDDPDRTMFPVLGFDCETGHILTGDRPNCQRTLSEKIISARPDVKNRDTALILAREQRQQALFSRRQLSPLRLNFIDGIKIIDTLHIYEVPGQPITLPTALRRSAAGFQSSKGLLLLIALASNIDVQDTNPASRKSALHCAILHNQPANASLLIEHAARSDIPDAHNKTAQDYAAESDSEEIRNLFTSATGPTL